jgi:glycosyltransferase involved in cell wall biosynthesis
MSARARLGISPWQPVVVMACRLEVEKGVQLAIRALPSLPADAILLIAGAGIYRQALADLAAQLGLHQRVRFLGFVSPDDLPDVLNAADVFALPTLREEGLPISLLEALATGLPVVASAAGGVPTAIEDGVNGFLIPRGDVGALVARLSQLLTDAALRERMGRSARSTAETRFSRQQMLEQTEAVFADIAARRVRAMGAQLPPRGQPP